MNEASPRLLDEHLLTFTFRPSCCILAAQKSPKYRDTLMIYLLVIAPQLERPALYYLQIGLMLAWLLVEALLDYILKIDFRQVRWMVISYIVLFFAGTSGMPGVAANAGREWTIAAGILFLLMALLAFVQRAVTGM